MSERRNWSWEDTLAAFALYFYLPSGQQTKQNKDVIALADAVGRTPSSVALKLENIKPWAASDSREKVSPDNGLLLNALHDRAFDQGLMTIDERMRIRVSSTVPRDGSYNDWLWSFDKREMRLPTRMRPRRDFVEYHNDVIFKG